jgi:uncharacterized RDD family membrane protein YckC
MFCSNCGTANEASNSFCVKCGSALAGATAAAQPVYAGFWIRVGAYLIDSFITGIGAGILMFVVAATAGVDADGGMFLVLLYVVTPWLYAALLESSARQATVGKMAVGIKVTGLDGRRIGFGRATGRYFAEILSSLSLGVGYAMVAFTKRRQSLHDLIAGTLVVRKEADPNQVVSAPPAQVMPGWAIVLIVLACMVPTFGILAAIAIPAYQDYTIRSQVVEGLVLASDVKAGVIEFAVQSGRWPADLEEAGIAADVASAVADSRYVGDIQVADGTIHIEYGGDANLRIEGQVLSLRPFITEDGEVVWQCGNSNDPRNGMAILELEDGSTLEAGENYTSLDDKFLPHACRSGFDGPREAART